MSGKNIPSWVLSLDVEDLEFIKKFVVNSGSLKKLADIYNVSYPTVRTRVDRLIHRIEIHNEQEEENLASFIRQLAIEERISLEDAKLLIEKYKVERKE
ncbi:hypothetical protein AAV35_013965 (plasmid) [Salimicrobium jeotgali]|uniref:DUF2089 family protein n=1 Tax=Salimicrobium jeotgali TaxID=1230341 RepID=K2G8U2_9BACI|nr:DUF2089 family protein [Salimicrobium jeotgali]AKG05851.1 hypothetical protein AAV35_013965 [Salimicrobium jeotgali]EKE30782.1 hypothetical protein MJ3_11710 [Salimicrobium jeotgali]MBM7697622.1 hypothetical protein [Salimicrobium jeotgali]